MLFKKCIVAPSKIHGLGLFANENITKDATISQWVSTFDRTFTTNELFWMAPMARAHVELYGFQRSPGGLWFLELDSGRFVNHSDTPNVHVLDDESHSSVALRDIEAGEELTENYGEFDWRGYSK